MKRFSYKYKMVALGLILCGLMACNKRLDIEPEQSIPTEVALSTSQNIENLLTGAYNRAGRIDMYGGRLQLLSDLYGFTDQAAWYGTFQQPRQVFNKSVLVDNSFVSAYWLDAYTLVNMTNLIIDHLEIVDEDIRADVSGGAKFLRGLTYFDLVRMFGAPYEEGQANSQLGVPIALSGIVDYTGNLEVARNTVQEVYAQVITDLNDAFEELPESNGALANRYTAKALLARVYLQQGNYAEARDAADEVILNSGHSLTNTYAAAFNNDANSSEDLFAIQVTSQDDAVTRENQLIVHYADQANGGRGGDVAVEGYVDLFDSDTDVRGDFFYVSRDYGDLLTSKYTNQFGNIPVIRLAEMYLIRAEANLRLGTSIGASPAADINTIRSRANASSKSSVTLDDILLERELELAFEGFLIHDLKRTGRAIGEFSYDNNALVYPIPQREMDANSLLVQNPGY
ncbi:RagB/SusD family nutrient uptake outer membrane protein [Olivibacter sp. SDN3]|uniref:RagB/SusD family nutrient uptake outer membrane protein n=1 Tax=Olivibacter sp. SDN3 TaxID=2764720 RepID=UPI001651A83A|nr:RagB/SusD family nutrient uptake outer membrane protein [Olivibacter sp. SDN3]QNL51732.1 RagB/SusD family nutrient uptake outer membrane protein [Olivibacter sp. SDN3]